MEEEDLPPEVELLSKVGFDGATGQSVWMQKTVEDGRDTGVEESLFMTCLVPIQLKCEGEIMWTNPKPSSTLYAQTCQITVR